MKNNKTVEREKKIYKVEYNDFLIYKFNSFKLKQHTLRISLTLLQKRKLKAKGRTIRYLVVETEKRI